jgi:hypothetical protein
MAGGSLELSENERERICRESNIRNDTFRLNVNELRFPQFEMPPENILLIKEF